MLDRSVTWYQRAPVFSVAADASLETARHRLEQHEVSCLAVADGPRALAGVISRTDLLRAGRAERGPQGATRLVLPAQKVRELMHSPVIEVEPAAKLQDAARLMHRHAVHRVFVGRHNTVLGVVSTWEVMRAIADARLKSPVSAAMSAPVATVAGALPLGDAVQRLRSLATSALVVLGSDGWPVGLFTQREALLSGDLDAAMPVDVVMSARVITVTASTAIHHAAAQAMSTRARHVLVMQGKELTGIVTGLDFARAAS